MTIQNQSRDQTKSISRDFYNFNLKIDFSASINPSCLLPFTHYNQFIYLSLLIWWIILFPREQTVILEQTEKQENR